MQEEDKILYPLEHPHYEWAALSKAFYDSVESRPVGICFMIRAKNEASNIGESIASLHRHLAGKMDYNIVFIDNDSTDDTFAIAQQHLRQSAADVAVRYPLQVAKAGLETYVTPCNSAHSLPWFYQFCLQQCTAFSHVFKWDADFRLTPKLAGRLIADFGANRSEPPAMRYEIPALHENNQLVAEFYLIGVASQYRYFRYFVWECWFVKKDGQQKRLADHEHIVHASKLEQAKDYLALPPWWHNVSAEVKQQEHVARAESDYNEWAAKLGSDTQLFCRSCDPACDRLLSELPYNKSEILGL